MPDAPVLLRYAVFAVVAALAGGALLALAVQRRVLNPFSRPARLIRDVTDPVIKPIERRLLRSGGNPQQAPWWLMGLTVLGGILAIEVAGGVAGMFWSLRAAAGSGGGSLVALLVDWSFRLLMLALVVRVIGSWLGATQWTPWMRPFHLATEWFLAPLRRVIPPFGMFDLTPLIAWFILSLLRPIVVGVFV